MTEPTELLPCPFCGGSVELEETTSYYNEMHGNRQWWGVVCRNTTNRGGSCAIQQRPSASKEASIDRWNRRTAPPAVAGEQTMADVIAACNGTEAFSLIMGLRAQVALLEAVIDEQKASAKSQPTQAQAGAVPLTADDLKQPRNGKQWRVEWWNESCRMLLPVDKKLDRFQRLQERHPDVHHQGQHRHQRRPACRVTP